ncbi:acyltransferase [Sphingomonas sp. LB-2]|uniref:acyltransferase family protein n=1 Tax=Sphingomonas caeni TaxID=2984949 RepID=UPI00222E78B2|nr:acyltransferase family protein [Sphingomonas caeni]MCW3845885.1 acyltransferase [Sphingomonas caeni]
MTEAGRYRPEIDGLRALAVLPVVLFHSGIPGFSGGYVGVDIFFVISGFLITRIIYSELIAGSFSIVHFYERRARRILPALTVVLIAATGVAALLMSATDMIQYAKALTATVFFASNLWFRNQTGGYFEPDVETHPLLHTWSLAVEEQFYIVFPLLLMACVRFLPGRVKPIVLLGTLASFAFAVWQVRASPNAAFYLAPARAWELGLGSVLALGLVPAVRHGTTREVLGWSAIALIVMPVLLYTSATPFPGLAALPPCLGAALIIQLGDSGAGRMLGWRPLIFIGLISYSLYLWHWPVIVLLKGVLAVSALPASWGAIGIAVSLVLATLSWRFVEQPFRSRARIGRRSIFLLSGCAMAGLVALAAGLWISRGLPARFTPAERALIEARFDGNPRRNECLDRLPGALCRIGASNATPSFLFWGDSHADALQPGIGQAAASAGRAGYAAARRSCAPLIGVGQTEPGCTEAGRGTINWLRAHPEIRTVVMIARWPLWRSGHYYAAEPGPPHPLLALTPGQRGLDRPALFDDAIRQTVIALRMMNRHVVILGDTPEIGWDVPTRLFAAHRFGTAAPAPPTAAEALARQADADRVLGALGVDYVPLLPRFCDTVCRTAAGSVPLYVDDDHVSAAGARMIAPLLVPLLR